MTSGQCYETNILQFSYYATVPHLHDVPFLHMIRCFVVKIDTCRHKWLHKCCSFNAKKICLFISDMQIICSPVKTMSRNTTATEHSWANTDSGRLLRLTSSNVPTQHCRSEAGKHDTKWEMLCCRRNTEDQQIMNYSLKETKFVPSALHQNFRAGGFFVWTF